MERIQGALIFALVTFSLAVVQHVPKPIALKISRPSSQSTSSTPPSKAFMPPDIVHYFSGNWGGKGKLIMSGKDVESDFSFVPEIEDQCILVHKKERPPNTFEYFALWSMDSVSGELVMLLASNHDSGARVFRSHGWQNDKVVFQSVPELHAFWALERITFERESAITFHTTYEMSMDDGKTWRVGDHQTFTKKASP
jgi:hypothetical protein